MGVVQWMRNSGEVADVLHGVANISKECIDLARLTTYLEIPTFPRGGELNVRKPASKNGDIECVLIYPCPPLISH
jgi:hypothetical protein